ncbi:Iron-responsive regulator Irr [hydrothermal vent metagenome]|uniref:Iron-responsive regulator Irr n=1 Tax=hydrothermal vent metagenome TaxID=652676 RepID=A0A3B1C373_9ZZZZ
MLYLIKKQEGFKAMELYVRNTTELANLLRDYGITATLQRVEIAGILLSKKQHLSAEQVMGKVNQGRSIVSKATVYNTLRLFAKKGLVKEVIADPTKIFYEPKTESHHHFYNVDTGELTDFNADLQMADIIPDAPEGMLVKGVDVTIRVGAA